MGGRRKRGRGKRIAKVEENCMEGQMDVRMH